MARRPYSIRLDEELVARVDAQAAADGVDRTEWIRRSIVARLAASTTPRTPPPNPSRPSEGGAQAEERRRIAEHTRATIARRDVTPILKRKP